MSDQHRALTPGTAPADPASSNGTFAAPEALWWGIQIQMVDVTRLDQYLASVSDQEQALHDSDKFVGRLVLRSQRSPERFWVIDAWTEQHAMESATIALRTLSSVAGLQGAPREVATAQVPVGTSGHRARPAAVPRAADAPLPFFLISEAHVKPASLDEYLSSQDTFTRELEEEPGFVTRRLLSAVREPTHFITLDEWTSEREAYEAFERRQNSLSDIAKTRFLTLFAERIQTDFALGVHG